LAPFARFYVALLRLNSQKTPKFSRKFLKILPGSTSVIASLKKRIIPVMLSGKLLEEAGGF